MPKDMTICFIKYAENQYAIFNFNRDSKLNKDYNEIILNNCKIMVLYLNYTEVYNIQMCYRYLNYQFTWNITNLLKYILSKSHPIVDSRYYNIIVDISKCITVH